MRNAVDDVLSEKKSFKVGGFKVLQQGMGTNFCSDERRTREKASLGPEHSFYDRDERT